MSRELLKLAFEAIERGVKDGYWNKDTVDVSTRIQKYLAEQAAQPQQEFPLRGILASELKCWHRLTEDEAQNLLAFVQNMPSKPAQQKPLIGETNVELGFYSNDASNGQQRELVGKVEMGQLVGNRSHESASNPDAKREIAVITGVDEYGPMLNWYTHWVNFPIGTKLYTSPPAQRKPLTDEEIGDLYYSITHQRWSSSGAWLKTFARAIEAAHGIKGDA